MLSVLEDIGLSPESIALARALLLGDKSLLSADTLQQFRGAGMSHLLAVSGLHVGIIAAVMWLALRPVRWLWQLAVGAASMWWSYRLPQLLSNLAVVVCLWAYVVMIGAPISAKRAALMLTLALWAVSVQRRFPMWHLWLAPACVLAVWEGVWPPTVGYVLSFAAVAGIMLMRPWLHDGRLPRLVRLLLLSLGAQMLTLPWVAFYFHQVPLLGFMQAVLVVPLLFPLVVMLLLCLVLPHTLASAVAVGVEALRGWMEQVADWSIALERLVLGGQLVFYPTWWEAVLATLFSLSLLLLLRRLHPSFR